MLVRIKNGDRDHPIQSIQYIFELTITQILTLILTQITNVNNGLEKKKIGIKKALKRLQTQIKIKKIK